MKKINYLIILLFLIAPFYGVGQTILTLDRALEIAGITSPDLQLSLFNLERTQESLNAKRAALKSQFLLNITPVEYSQDRIFDDFTSVWYTSENFESYGNFAIQQPIAMTDGTITLNNRMGWGDRYSGSSNIRNKSFYNNLYLEFSQPLFTYNRTKLEIKELELDHENAMLSYAMQMLNLEKNVSQFFFDVYFAQVSLQIKKEEYANTQKSFEIINNKVEAGLSAREELYQAAVNLETANSTVENQRVALENAKDLFKQYIGMDIFEPVTVMNDIEIISVVVDEKKAIEHGVASRMEIRQREIDVETSQFDLIRTKSQNEFRGEMNLSIGLSGDDEELGNVFDNPTRSPKAKISFNIPLFDWGERKARIRAQEAIIKSSELRLDNEVIQIKIDIRKVLRNLQNLLNQIEIEKKNEKNSQLSYDIMLEKYEYGDVTSMDLNLSQVQLSEKKMGSAQSLINYRIELLNLKIQTLYDFAKDEPVVPEVFFEEYKSKLKN